MTMPVIIVGAGGHARVLVDALRTAGRPILGVVDPKLTTDAAGPLGLKVLGGDEALGQYCADKIELVNGIGGTGSTERRHDVFAQFCARGFRFSSVVHRSAVVSEFAELGQGVQVMAGCVIQCGAIIGANTIINTNASIDHDCKIGQSVHVAPGVTLSGAATIGDRSHIGTGACVIQGIKIGQRCLVAAGAVVYRDLADGQRLVKRDR
jgi:sugar O-acyltransferase (sialic acid O-acetyltransferase NeuD family)